MGNKLIDYLMIDHDTAYHNALQAFKGHNLQGLEQALHILYNKGYEDGIKVGNANCDSVWEKRIDEIKADISEYEKECQSTVDTETCKKCKEDTFRNIERIINMHVGGDAE